MIYKDVGGLLERRVEQGWAKVHINSLMIDQRAPAIRWLELNLGPRIDGLDLSDSMTNGEWDLIHNTILIKDRGTAMLFKLTWVGADAR